MVFIENNGMAYGMEIGSKLILSIFRIIAVAILGKCKMLQPVLLELLHVWLYYALLEMVRLGAAYRLDGA